MAKYRILSFDGGGLRGVISLGILRRLSAELGGEDWIGKADLLAGTSTGGLIALCLAAGKPVAEIQRFYTEQGPAIFDRRSWTWRSSLGKLLHAGYDNRGLEKALDGMFGDATLDQLPRKALVVSFDLDKKEGKRSAWAPKVFQNCEGPGQDRHLVRRVGLYTSAAPTYLPSVDGYIDGGVCANNPSMCALAQVLDTRLAQAREAHEIHLLSVGTGVSPECVPRKTVKWGILGWNLRLLRVIMDGSTGIADYQCRQILTPERYLRLQTDLTEQIELDDAARIPEMEALAAGIDAGRIREWAGWIREKWLAG